MTHRLARPMKGDAAVLHVDLTQQTSERVALPEEARDGFLGGRGLGSYLLARYLPSDTDPLDAHNPLILTSGPLQGTHAPFSGKAVLTFKSPLTGIYCFSVASGELGVELARCGFLALVVTGRALRPTYLWIHGDRVNLFPARGFWLSTTSQAMGRISEQTGCPPSAIAAVGPAAANGVRFANVITGGARMRAFGRGGGGAVMGSKLLKGIAIQGSTRVQAADSGLFREARQSVNRAIASRRDWAQRRRAEGTTTSMGVLQEYGMLPTRNWQQGSFEGFARLAPGAHQPDVPWQGESVPCAASCPAPCARRYRVTGGRYAGAESNGPDYETIYAFGSNCGIDRFDSIVAADRLCDELGLDTISAGVTIGFVMECAARGLLEGNMAALGPSFGDHRAVVALLPQLAHRQGLGEWLAEGTQRCSEMLGQGTEAFAMHAKGLELGGWGCRGTYGQAIQYALGSRGGCHHDLGLPAKSEYALPESTAVEGKGELVLRTGSERIALDSAVICSFACQYVDLGTVASLLTAVTGRPFSTAYLETVGERVLNVERLLNAREGIDREADQLPDRLQRDPLPDGPRQGAVVPLEPLKTEFYRAAGWDETTGIPTPATLERLGISDVFSTATAAGAVGRRPPGPSEDERPSTPRPGSG